MSINPSQISWHILRLKPRPLVANFVVDHNLVFESSVFDNLRTIENTTRNIIELQNRYLQNQSQKNKTIQSRSLQKHHFNLLQSHKDLTTFPKMILERAQRELDRAQGIDHFAGSLCLAQTRI